MNNVTLYFPYENAGVDAFDSDVNFSASSYIEQLNNDFNSTNKAINASMNGVLNGNKSLLTRQNHFNDNFIAKTNKTPKNAFKTEFTSCEGILQSETGDNETVDSMLKYYASGDVCIFSILLDFDSIEEEFEEELKMWTKTHNNVIAYGKQQLINQEDWILRNEPAKSIKFSMKNKNGEIVYGWLNNCKILENNNPYTYIVLAESVDFTKE